MNIFNKFKKTLGQYCAINQFIELSNRCFISEHGADIADREQFISLATQNAISLTHYDSQAHLKNISRSYIVNVHLCFETFLKDLNEEIKKYGKKQYKEKDTHNGESWLQCVTKNIVEGKLPNDIQKLYDLCEYYRLVRNSSVHDLHDVNEPPVAFSKLKKYDFNQETKFKKLSAPNYYSDISFDDFIMFARSAQELAEYLYKNLSYDYEKIILDVPTTQKIKFRKHNNDEERCKKAIKKYVDTFYVIDESFDAELPRLVEITMAQ